MARQINFFDGASSETTPIIGNVVASNLIQYADDASYEAAELGAPQAGNVYYNTTDNVIRYYDAADMSWKTLLESEPEDGLFFIKGDGDNTKKVRFEVDGLTTGTTRVITTFDADGVMVLEAAPQTLTNKTIVAADNTITTAASGNLTSTELNAALDELQVNIDSVQGEVDAVELEVDQLILDVDAVELRVDDLETEIVNKQDVSEKGQPNGYASLDGAGKVPTSQLPTKLMEFEGNWDASTNTPTLDNTDVDLQGTTYRVSVAGSVDFGAGPISFDIGDWVYNTGSLWERGDNVDQVVSVNGQTGTVDLALDDISDVDLSTPATDGQVLTYQSGSWIAEDSAGTVTSVNGQTGAVVLDLDDINDVNLSTPATDGQVLTYQSGEWLAEDPTGTGSGGINYILNPDAEKDIDGWLEYDDSAATPVDGTGGTPTQLSLARTTTASFIQRGEASFLISKLAADAQGEGVAYDFTIDPADKLKNLEITFDYTTFTGYADDLTVYIYDVDNATLLLDVINDQNGVVLDSAGVSGKFLGFFDATDSLNYRLIFHNTTSTTNAWDMSFDTVKVGPPNTFNVGPDNFLSTTELLQQTVRARYTTDAGQVLPNAATTIVNFEDLEYDNRSAVTTGAAWKFTAPKTGYYRVASAVNAAGAGAGAGGFIIIIFKNNVAYARGNRIPGVNGSLGVVVAATVFMTAGDFIDVRIENQTGNTRTLEAAAQSCHVQIDSIPDFSIYGTYPSSATKADQEAATSTTHAVTPSVQQFHPSAAKGWCSLNGTGTISIHQSYNVSGIVDRGEGQYTVNWDQDFAADNYAYSLACSTEGTQNTFVYATQNTVLAGSIGFEVHRRDNGGTIDTPSVAVIGFGDLA